jgi:hypothetical protein
MFGVESPILLAPLQRLGSFADNSPQPCLCVMYFLNYVDRNAIAQARLNNLEEDLNMTGTEFNTTVSMYVIANSEI